MGGNLVIHVTDDLPAQIYGPGQRDGHWCGKRSVGNGSSRSLLSDLEELGVIQYDGSHELEMRDRILGDMFRYACPYMVEPEKQLRLAYWMSPDLDDRDAQFILDNIGRHMWFQMDV